MNFELPPEVQDYLSRLDAFSEEITLPLQRKDDNERFFDHRRESSRTQWHNQGLPTEDWENLLQRARALADEAGFYRFACPKEYGGSEKDSLNLYMCAIRYHLASHPVYGGGVSLANDLQTEHSVVGNNPFVIMLYHYGSAEQKDKLIPANHATVLFTNVLVPTSAVLGPLDNGLAIAQTFTHENRIRQAASSCGAARFCIDRSVEHANKRHVFGKPLSYNQAIQWPLVELSTQEEMIRLLILRTALEMDKVTSQAVAAGEAPWVTIEKQLSHKIGMCNYYANRLVCEAADRAIQIHGGDGYSRHLPFEHIWRHFRRYRITEGSEEVQMRKVSAYLFGYKKTGVLKGTSKQDPKL